jgi:hypothetical protein
MSPEEINIKALEYAMIHAGKEYATFPELAEVLLLASQYRDFIIGKQ